MLTHAVFDLDDTLYPQGNGLWTAIGRRISLYMIERLGLPPAEVVERRDSYFRAFGTTLNGLLNDYRIDPADYLDFAHDLRLDDYLQPDPELDAMLAGLPLRKSIFTNADAKHAQRVLDCLGIARHFETVVDIWALDFVNKPQLRAYQVLLAALGAPAGESAFVEDSLRNLQPARALGMKTIWVSPAAVSDEVDFVARRVHDVGAILHGLA